jgi:hypothetical protein
MDLVKMLEEAVGSGNMRVITIPDPRSTYHMALGTHKTAPLVMALLGYTSSSDIPGFVDAWVEFQGPREMMKVVVWVPEHRGACWTQLDAMGGGVREKKEFYPDAEVYTLTFDYPGIAKVVELTEEQVGQPIPMEYWSTIATRAQLMYEPRPRDVHRELMIAQASVEFAEAWERRHKLFSKPGPPTGYEVP